MKEALVSVIMPAYNGDTYIAEAIESIQNQTWKHWELIIVEDCSQDSTLEEIKKYLNDPRIKVYQNERNIGIAGSRNKAIQVSNGKYIAIQDDDDISFPGRLEVEARFLDEHAEIDAVAGHWMRVDETGNEILFFQKAFNNPKYVRAHLLLQDCIGNGSAMFRRNFILKHNLLYRDNMLGMEDYCFWIEFSKLGNISAVNRFVYKQRQHSERETAKRTWQNETDRRRLFLELRKQAMAREGIKLSPDSLDVLYQMADEKTDPNLTIEDYKELTNVLREIINQANELKLENAEEIAIACRKYLGIKIANSKGFWNG